MNPDTDSPVSLISRHIPEVINLRGQIHPIIDIEIKFGMEQTQITGETCIIVINMKKTLEGIAKRQYPDPGKHKLNS
jgi:purine-binding chemotaxis protein CheW